MLQSLPNTHDQHVLMATGNGLFSLLFYDRYNSFVGVRVMPNTAFTPFRWSNRTMRRLCFHKPCSEYFPEAYGIHHHSNSWFPDTKHQLQDAHFDGSAFQPADGKLECWNGDVTFEACCDVLRWGPLQHR